MEQEFNANEKLVHPVYGEVEYKHEAMDDSECVIETANGKTLLVSKNKLKKLDKKD